MKRAPERSQVDLVGVLERAECREVSRREPALELSEIEARGVPAEVVEQHITFRSEGAPFARELASSNTIAIGLRERFAEFGELGLALETLRRETAGDVEGFGPCAGGLGEYAATLQAP